MYLEETNNIRISPFKRWFKTVDLINLILIFLLASIGMMIVTTASPSIALNKGFESFYFVEKHLIYLTISLSLIIFFSTLSNKGIIRFSAVGLTIFSVMLLVGLIINETNNGSSRWLKVSGLSLQPSEFIKPFFIVVSAYLLSKKNKILFFNVSGNLLSIGFLSLLVISLYLQPDFGMLMVISMVWCCQYFILGLKAKSVLVIIGAVSIVTLLGYFNLGHVQNRIDSFLSPDHPGYQVKMSLEAYKSGGILGKGPGEGIIKDNIPDSHTDFIFPVVAEEYGWFACIAIILIIMFILLRGLYRTKKTQNIFTILAATGLLMLFGFQAFINVSVSLQLAPTTGITLPFISYGGSSLLSMGITMGMMLSLTRRPFGGKLKL